MHPIEHLRYVARGGAVSQRVLLREALDALASFTWDPAGMVLACRRLVALQTGSGALVWLAARVLTAPDPGEEVALLRAELDDDPTASLLRGEVADDARVAVLDQVELVPAALASRGDVSLLVVSMGERSVDLGRRAGSAVVERVPAHGLGAAASTADAAVVEALGVGPGAVLARSGSRALAATASTAGVRVVVVGSEGTVLPPRMWEPFVGLALGEGPPALDAPLELVPFDLVDVVVGPRGAVSPQEAADRSSCPVAPELFAGVVV